MIKNYIKTAWRNLVRNKAFSLINISGLALGMACSLLIFLWVKDERSVDMFNKNGANLYDVYERVFSEGKVEAANWTPGQLANELKRNIPEIQYASGFWAQDESLFEAGEKIISMKGSYADSDFFKMFSYRLLEGTQATALTGPDDIAVSRTMADNFFGSPVAAFGKTIRYNNSRVFRISAVFEDLPENSSEKFDYVCNWASLPDSITWLKEWIYRGPYTFVQLRQNTSPEQVEAKIKSFLNPYLKGGEGSGFRLELGLQRFEDMYLNSTFKNGRPDGGRIEYVRLFSMVAIFILLIACINFMNLATARSVKRAKEVGIRKTIGAVRRALIGQFIGEALLLALLAVFAALIGAILLLPLFNDLTGKQIVLPLSTPTFWGSLLGLTVLTGLVSGSYPALFLSSLNPIKVLKGSLIFSSNALGFRKGLVVFQFVLSIVLIIGTIVIARQVNFLQTQNLGFSKENLVYVPLDGDLSHQYAVFEQRISSMPGIKEVTHTDQPPTQTGAHAYDMEWAGKNPNTKTVVIHVTVGYDFLKAMNLQLLQGRDFSRDFPTDSTGYIINETALKMIGYKDPGPIGQPLGIFQQHKGRIIGVVKDFHFKSLHEPIEPLLINLKDSITRGFALVKTQAGKTREAIASLEKVCKQLAPKFPFTYYFADEEYKKLYNSEQTISKLSNCFSFLAIFISCLGLLGLMIFTAAQRTKEIGVRKVIGAGALDIVVLLSTDIFKLVALSAIIAMPISWMAMNHWLQGFAYRTDISWWVFAVAGFLAMIVALLTICYQALKAALADPVKNLRAD